MAETKDEMQDIWAVTCDAAIPCIAGDCPHCGKALSLKRKAIFEKNVLTTVTQIKEGHLLQASTVGGMIVEMAKLMKIAAKEMGVKIEVLITAIKFEGNELEIKYASVEAGKQPERVEPVTQESRK